MRPVSGIDVLRAAIPYRSTCSFVSCRHSSITLMSLRALLGQVLAGRQDRRAGRRASPTARVLVLRPPGSFRLSNRNSPSCLGEPRLNLCPARS